MERGDNVQPAPRWELEKKALAELVPLAEVNPMQAYCVKCRVKREMKDSKAITMKNGKPAT